MSRNFRRWLIDKLKQSHFTVYRNEDVTATAKRLGVDPELLRIAQREKSKEFLADGRMPQVIGSHNRVGKPVLLNLFCPQLIDTIVNELCSRRHVSRSEFLRGIVHTVLTNHADPLYIEKWWCFRGEVYRLPRKIGERSPWSIKTHISYGADQALRLRAQRVGASKVAFARGAVIDFLEGRTKNLHFVPLAAMWEDPNRYWTGHAKVSYQETKPT